MKLADNPLVRELVRKRMEEFGWKQSDLINDASERRYTINTSRLSKWFRNKPGAINDTDLIWIMERLGIQYNVNFGKPIIRNGKLIYEVGAYDELQALTRLNSLFSKNNEQEEK